MLEWFKIGFGLGLGLVASLLALALSIGLIDTFLTKWQWRRTFGGRR